MAHEEQSPVPDELARVRAQIARLREREQQLRRVLITDPETRIGGEYVARVVKQDMRHIPLVELREADPDLFMRLVKHRTVVQIRLSRIGAAEPHADEDGANGEA